MWHGGCCCYSQKSLLPGYMHFLLSLFYSQSSFIYSFIHSYFFKFFCHSESKWWGMKMCRTNSQIPLTLQLHSVEQQHGFFNIPPLSDWVGLVKLFAISQMGPIYTSSQPSDVVLFSKTIISFLKEQYFKHW